MKLLKKLLLGTANFGMDYGISFGKRVPKDEVFRMLDLAKEKGILGIDTAPAYGEAEEVIGEYLQKRGKSFSVITKLPKRSYKDTLEVKNTFLKSLENLKVDSVDYLLIHSFETYIEYKEKILQAFEFLREEKLIRAYGLSVYHPQEVMEFLKDVKGDFAVEFPLNVFDRRFMPYLREWKALNITLFARSVFLQGLFFLPEDKLNGRFERVKDKILRLRLLAEESKLSLACLCLGFVASFEEIDGLVVGMDSHKQLEEITSCLEAFEKPKFNLEDLEVRDEDIILPYRW